MHTKAIDSSNNLDNASNQFKDYTLLSIFSFLIYLNSLFGDFTYDDHRAILNNQDVSSLSEPWYRLFANDYWGTSIRSSNSHGSYRPLTTITFRLNYLLHGLRPFGYHLVNLLLHLTVIILYSIVLRQILTVKCNTGHHTATNTGHNDSKRPATNYKLRRITLIASILFAAHPIHTESVASIVGRSDIIAAIFYLLSIYFYIKYCKNGHRMYILLTISMAILSMFAKEHGITCLPLCIVYHLFILNHFNPFKWKNWMKIIRKSKYKQLRIGLLSLTLSLLILTTIRIQILKYRPTFSSADNPISDSKSVIIRTMTFIYLPVFNFYLLLYPRNLCFDWSMNSVPLVQSFLDYRNCFTIVFYTCLAVVIVRTIRYYSLLSVAKSKKSSSKSNHRSTKQHNSNHQRHKHHNRLNNQLIDYNNNNINHHGDLNHFDEPLIDLNNNHSQMMDQNVDFNNNNHNSNGFDYRAQSTTFETTVLSSNVNQCHRSNHRRKHRSHGGHKHLESSKILIRKHLSEYDCIALSLSMMIIPYLPATNLFFYIGFVIAERILYVPSFGFCLLVAICIEKSLQLFIDNHRVRYLIYSSLTILVIAFSLRTIQRNVDWLNEENLYRSGGDINPPKALGNLANILSQKGRIDEAEQMYRKALEYRPNMADVHYNLGLLLQNQQRLNESIDCYHQAIRYRPSLAMAYLNLGIVYWKLGDTTKAKKYLEYCSKLNPYGLKDVRTHESSRISALYNLGKLYFEEKNYDKTFEIFNQTLRQLPEYYPMKHLIFNKLSEVYFELNHIQNAEQWLRRSLKFNPKYVPTYLLLAKVFIRTNRTDDVEELYSKALSLSYAQNDTSIYHHYGQFKIDQGQLNEALEIYTNASKRFPNDCDIIIAIAHLLRETNQTANAESYYELATKLRPKDIRTHSNLGAIYHLNGKFHQAKQSYEHVLRMQPNDNITRINLRRLDRILRQQPQQLNQRNQSIESKNN